MTAPFWAAHRQLDHRVRFDWGPTGAAAIAEGADVAVVVDVLSFTTTLCVAVERGMTVLPYRW
ncbi:MAG TPA: 2-phosphosulfolactate phosphatase, partial [Nocardioides sp.]|nr:2-phosphosulfolactate phosphatase [Nocardioides sp.]